MGIELVLGYFCYLFVFFGVSIEGWVSFDGCFVAEIRRLVFLLFFIVGFYL